MNSKPFNIIVADDDSDDQYFLTEAIKKNSHHRITSVYNGAQLMDLLLDNEKNTEQPDLILLDLNMPVMDGFAALSRIKKNAKLKHIPVFVLTTSRRENDKTTCRLLGADEFFSKPSELTMLNGLVEDILGKVSASRNNA
jgi:CheY-like chemotaxis protein